MDSKFQNLKQRVLDGNLALLDAGLVVLTWGNGSAVDRRLGVMAIKPSGIPYASLKVDDIVVLNLESGQTVEGAARPSSDTPTHLHLYRQFPALGGIAHTHSTYGTCFAQALRDIPCFGTTHADNFHGPIPVTRPMTDEEIQNDYELNTGRVIVECFRTRSIDPAGVPSVLVASHAPFAWGPTIEKAVENAIVLEFAAQMALNSLALSPGLRPINGALLDRHFLRKHGPKATYGQARTESI
jgi:L-ribulose-5-phosphate 4-epimerase